MSFNIILKKNLSENNRVYKEFDTSSVTLTGNLRKECSITEPEVVVEVTSSQVTGCNISDFNYAEIETFNRRYFITGMTVGPYNVNPATNVQKCLWTLQLKCDVLSTYADELENCKIIIERTETDETQNFYINDNLLFKEQREKVTTHHFRDSNGSIAKFDNNAFWNVLLVAGS